MFTQGSRRRSTNARTHPQRSSSSRRPTAAGRPSSISSRSGPLIEDELRQVGRELGANRARHFQRQRITASGVHGRRFEIDIKGLNEARQRHTELDASAEQLRADIAARRQARPEEESAQREVVESWERRRSELLEIVHQLSNEARQLEADLQPKNRARFLRLLESKKGTAIAAVVEGSCSVCHFAVRPHLRQRLRRCQEIITCESCYRILYLEESLTREPTEATSG
jgi:hypothetical protein